MGGQTKCISPLTRNTRKICVGHQMKRQMAKQMMIAILSRTTSWTVTTSDAPERLSSVQLFVDHGWFSNGPFNSHTFFFGSTHRFFCCCVPRAVRSAQTQHQSRSTEHQHWLLLNAFWNVCTGH